MGATRAQVVTFLWRAAGSPAPKGDASKFTDLVADAYYVKAVAWAIEQGITKGTSETTFEPETVCTRTSRDLPLSLDGQVNSKLQMSLRRIQKVG